MCQSVASTGSGSPPGPPSGGGGSGGGGGDDGHGSSKPSAKNSLLKGWEERIAADPQFTYKVFVEQVGAPVGAALLAMLPQLFHLLRVQMMFAYIVVQIR